MAIALQHKVVSALPGTPEPNSIYYVRIGTGFEIYVTNDQGTVVAYPANYAKLPIAKQTNISDPNFHISGIREVSSLPVSMTWRPAADGESVVPTMFVETTVDTTDAPTVGLSHSISLFHYVTVKGGKTHKTHYNQEYRLLLLDGSHIDEYIAQTHVLEPKASSGGQNNGTVGTYVLEELPDLTATVDYVSQFLRRLVDPRLLTWYGGGTVKMPLVLTAGRTMTDVDSDKDIYVVSATDVTINLPNTLRDGWRSRFVQVSTGRINFTFDPGLAVLESDGLTSTQGAGLSADVCVVPGGGFAKLVVERPSALNYAIHPGLRPGRLYGFAGRNTLLGLQDVPVSANVLYPVPIRLAHRKTISTVGVRVSAALSGQNLRLALFANDNGLPGARIWQSGDLSTGTAGDKQVTGLSITLEPGFYFLGVVASGGVTLSWACVAGLEEIFGRPSSVSLDVLPLYAMAVTAIPADLTGVAPGAYANLSNYLPDVYFGVS